MPSLASRTYSVSVDMIKELRQSTGAPLSDCKKALAEANGDIAKATEWLKAKGVSAAAKKSGRRAAEGLAGVRLSEDGRIGAVLEINSETDFVARNSIFQELFSSINETALQAAKEHGPGLTTEAFSQFPFRSSTVDTVLKESVGVIGENIQLRRVQTVHADDSTTLFSYVHNSVAPNMGKIATLLALKAAGTSPEDLKALGTQLCMHITAMAPEYLFKEQVPAETVENTRKILLEESNGNERAANGRLNKFFEGIVLNEQMWLMDNKKAVKQILKENNVEIVDFVRYAVGQGL